MSFSSSWVTNAATWRRGRGGDDRQLQSTVSQSTFSSQAHHLLLQQLGQKKGTPVVGAPLRASRSGVTNAGRHLAGTRGQDGPRAGLPGPCGGVTWSLWRGYLVLGRGYLVFVAGLPGPRAGLPGPCGG
eukprot:4365529-Pyramimonas_sp.AAC.1